ncbi:MAG TPA: hypothetical protein VIU11_26085 [Nakamurella sp.]
MTGDQIWNLPSGPRKPSATPKHRTRDRHAFTSPAEHYRLVGELGPLPNALPQPAPGREARLLKFLGT